MGYVDMKGGGEIFGPVFRIDKQRMTATYSSCRLMDIHHIRAVGQKTAGENSCTGLIYLVCGDEEPLFVEFLANGTDGEGFWLIASHC